MQPTLKFEQMEMPVASLGKESCVPDLMGEAVLQNQLTFDLDEHEEIFQGYGKCHNTYPYRQYNTYTRTLSNCMVDVAVLENQYLKATFLPHYGGRLWSLIDKTTNTNLLYTNDVLQFSNLAVRNAWFSGGVEWNMGIIGHNPFTTAPLYTAQLEEKGVPVLRMYEYERIRKVYFQMDFWLGKTDRFLNCRMKLINEREKLVPMYWWSNIAVPEYENGRIVVPAEKAYTLKNMRVYKADIPMVDGIDVTAYQNIKTSIDYFFDIPQQAPKYIANVNADGYGLLQVSSNRLVSRKLFCWGNHSASDHWQEFLTQKAGRYIEIQAGLGKTQYGCIPMAPHTVWEWVEQYGPVKIDSSLMNASHPERYEAINQQLKRQNRTQKLEQILTDTIPMSKKKAEIVAEGSGYGSLMEQGALSNHLEFTCCEKSLEPWAEFLKTGVLHQPDPSVRPDYFFADKATLQLLKKTINTSNKYNWYAHYQLGVRLLAKGKYKKAEKELRTSLDLQKNAWAFHGLACLKYNQRKPKKAISYMAKGIALQPSELSYLKDGFKLIVACEGFSSILALYKGLSIELQENSRLKFYYTLALHRIGKDKEAFELLKNPEGFVLEDIREGEDSIAQLWIDVTKALGKEEPIPYAYNFKAYV